MVDKVLIILLHKFRNNRHYMLAEAAAVEDTVMADIGLGVMFLHSGRQGGAEFVRRFGLASA